MKDNMISVILTGATGMVGEGVLHECLNHSSVQKVLIINRKTAGISHPKLTEIIQEDLNDLEKNAKFMTGYDTCFYCIGTTSMGKTEMEYDAVTYRVTLGFANALLAINSHISFSYISAAGSDVTELGDTMWARVKGKTENELAKLHFRSFHSFRPLMLTPTAGLKHTHDFYKLIAWAFPLGRLIFPKTFCTLRELGLAMIKVAVAGYPDKFIEVADMVKLAKRPEIAK